MPNNQDKSLSTCMAMIRLIINAGKCSLISVEFGVNSGTANFVFHSGWELRMNGLPHDEMLILRETYFI